MIVGSAVAAVIGSTLVFQSGRQVLLRGSLFKIGKKLEIKQ
jgi:hypothetical protein